MQPESTLTGWLIIVLLGGLLLFFYGLIIWGWVILPIPLWVKILGAAIVIGYFVWTRPDRREDAQPDDLCSFARSFDTDNIDTWVIRATHEALRSHARPANRPAAVRAEDSFAAMDVGDIEEIIHEIIERTGRNFSDFEKHSPRGQMNTVRDLVEAINLLPLAPSKRLEV